MDSSAFKAPLLCYAVVRKESVTHSIQDIAHYSDAKTALCRTPPSCSSTDDHSVCIYNNTTQDMLDPSFYFLFLCSHTADDTADADGCPSYTNLHTSWSRHSPKQKARQSADDAREPHGGRDGGVGFKIHIFSAIKNSGGTPLTSEPLR